VSKSQLQARQKVISSLRKHSFWNTPHAIVRVQAKDFEAARLLAINQTTKSLDTVNFFVELLPYNYGWLYLPETAQPVLRRRSATACDLGEFNWGVDSPETP